MRAMKTVTDEGRDRFRTGFQSLDRVQVPLLLHCAVLSLESVASGRGRGQLVLETFVLLQGLDAVR